MLNSLKIILSSALIFVASCSYNPVGPDSADYYFPLHQGNKWFYRSYRIINDSVKYITSAKEYDSITEVIGQKSIESKNYSVLENRYFSRLHSPLPDTVFCRFEGTKFIEIRKFYQRDGYYQDLVVDFSVAEGDTFHFLYQNKYTYVGTVLKKTYDTMKVSFDIPGGADDEFEVTFTRDVGMVRRFSTAWQMGDVLSNYERK